ncbi:hypothetical protein MBLNU459_g4363t1 [Dothideomycetes sp. NU459]
MVDLTAADDPAEESANKHTPANDSGNASFGDKPVAATEEQYGDVSQPDTLMENNEALNAYSDDGERSAADDDPWLCFAHDDDAGNHGACPGKPLRNLPFRSTETGIWIGNYACHDESVQDMVSYNGLIQRSDRKELVNGTPTFPDTIKSYMTARTIFVHCRGESCSHILNGEDSNNEMLRLEKVAFGPEKVVIYPFYIRELTGNTIKLFAIVYREKYSDWKFFKADGGYYDTYSLYNVSDSYAARRAEEHLRIENDPDPNRSFQQYCQLYDDEEYHQDDVVREGRRPNTRSTVLEPLVPALPQDHSEPGVESERGRLSRTNARPRRSLTKRSETTRTAYNTSGSMMQCSSTLSSCDSDDDEDNKTVHPPHVEPEAPVLGKAADYRKDACPSLRALLSAQAPATHGQSDFDDSCIVATSTRNPDEQMDISSTSYKNPLKRSLSVTSNVRGKSLAKRTPTAPTPTGPTRIFGTDVHHCDICSKSYDASYKWNMHGELFICTPCARKFQIETKTRGSPTCVTKGSETQSLQANTIAGYAPQQRYSPAYSQTTSPYPATFPAAPMNTLSTTFSSRPIAAFRRLLPAPPQPPALLANDNTDTDFDRILRSVLAVNKDAMSDEKIVAMFRDIAVAQKAGTAARVRELETGVWKLLLTPP